MYIKTNLRFFNDGGTVPTLQHRQVMIYGTTAPVYIHCLQYNVFYSFLAMKPKVLIEKKIMAVVTESPYYLQQ